MEIIDGEVGLSRDEIVKALRICSDVEINCHECPNYDKENEKYYHNIKRLSNHLVHSLIYENNSQKKEIELLRNEKEAYMFRANESSKMDALEGVMDMLTAEKKKYENYAKCILEMCKEVSVMIQEERLNLSDRLQEE